MLSSLLPPRHGVARLQSTASEQRAVIQLYPHTQPKDDIGTTPTRILTLTRNHQQIIGKKISKKGCASPGFFLIELSLMFREILLTCLSAASASEAEQHRSLRRQDSHDNLFCFSLKLRALVASCQRRPLLQCLTSCCFDFPFIFY